MKKIVSSLVIMAVTMLMLSGAYFIFSTINNKSNNIYYGEGFKVLFEDSKGVYIENNEEKKSFTIVNTSEQEKNIDLVLVKENNFVSETNKDLIDFRNHHFSFLGSEYKSISETNDYMEKIAEITLKPGEIISREIKFKETAINKKVKTYMRLLFEI